MEKPYKDSLSSTERDICLITVINDLLNVNSSSFFNLFFFYIGGLKMFNLLSKRTIAYTFLFQVHLERTVAINMVSAICNLLATSSFVDMSDLSTEPKII